MWWFWLCATSSIFWRRTVGNTPITVPASQSFDGNDGQWSTFWIQIGTPAQPIKVLPGTSAAADSASWAILPEGCSRANPNLNDCASLRGNLFDPNKSSTWSTAGLENNGLYTIVSPEEDNLGLSAAARYGFDTIQLGIANSPTTLTAQLVAGIATNNYWLGTLGLSPNYFDFSNYSSPVPSLIHNLRNVTPCNAWAYTAGAFYTNPPTFGSLVIGGFDDSRRDKNRTLYDIPFYDDSARDLLVALQGISYSTESGTAESLMNASSGAYMFVDSMVSQLWLPEEVCNRFEQAFSLSWNSTAELYYVDNATHQALLEANPTFNFTIGVNFTTSESINITLPYAAFDLSVSEPFVDNGSALYFPLKRATSASQYTLGRVFLQGAYLLANYESKNFTIAQALYPSPGTESVIYSMLPPGFKPIVEKKSTVLSAGEIAGIAVSISIGAVILGLGAYYVIRRRWSRKQQTEEPLPFDEKKHDPQDLDKSFAKPELDAYEVPRYELESMKSMPINELSAGRQGYRQEMSNTGEVFELPSWTMHELPSKDVAAAELESRKTPDSCKA